MKLVFMEVILKSRTEYCIHLEVLIYSWEYQHFTFKYFYKTQNYNKKMKKLFLGVLVASLLSFLHS